MSPTLHFAGEEIGSEVSMNSQSYIIVTARTYQGPTASHIFITSTESELP